MFLCLDGLSSHHRSDILVAFHWWLVRKRSDGAGADENPCFRGTRTPTSWTRTTTSVQSIKSRFVLFEAGHLLVSRNVIQIVTRGRLYGQRLPHQRPSLIGCSSALAWGCWSFRDLHVKIALARHVLQSSRVY